MIVYVGVYVRTSASGVSLHVQSQVVGAGEGPLTQQTLVGLLARVLAVVTRQLI